MRLILHFVTDRAETRQYKQFVGMSLFFSPKKDRCQFENNVSRGLPVTGFEQRNVGGGHASALRQGSHGKTFLLTQQGNTLTERISLNRSGSFSWQTGYSLLL
jgi:hypothetical protein